MGTVDAGSSVLLRGFDGERHGFWVPATAVPEAWGNSVDELVARSGRVTTPTAGLLGLVGAVRIAKDLCDVVADQLLVDGSHRVLLWCRVVQ
jgi:hypothetical protein